MRILDFEIENYKSIKNQHLSPSGLTVLIGKNNSGKSNVIDAISDYQERFGTGITREWHEKRVTEKDTDLEVTVNFHARLSNSEYQRVLGKVKDSHRMKFSDREWFRELRVYRNMHPDNHPNSEHFIYANIEADWEDINKVQNSDPIEDGFNGLIRSIVEDSVESWKFVDPFREPRDFEQPSHVEEMSRDARDLINTLQTLDRSPRSDVYDAICNAFVDIMEGVKEVTIEHNLDSNERDFITLVIREDGYTGRYKADEISSGSKEILVLLTQVFASQGETDLLAIEEPELHLHPGAEKKLFDIINEIAKDDGPQVIISTHSEVFVDYSKVDNIVTVRKDPFTTLESIDSDNWDGEEVLGFDHSDLVQADTVVFVEGRSDKVVLEEFARTIDNPFKNHNVELIVGNGDQIKRDAERIVSILRQLGISYRFIFDSDGEEPSTKEVELASQLDVSPEHIYVLERDDIESYLIESPKPIAQAIAEEEKTVKEYIDFDEVGTSAVAELNNLFTDAMGTGYDKEVNGAAIAKHMDKDDTPDEIKELIRRLVD